MKRIFAILLSAVMLFFAACAAQPPQKEPAVYVAPNRPAEGSSVSSDKQTGYLGFSADIMKKIASSDDLNPCVSPASLYFALSMAANGADGETRSSMEDVLGMSVADLNEVNRLAFSNLLFTGGKTVLNIGNSAWIDEKFGIDANYLNTIKDVYGAAAYNRPLGSEETRKEINSWVGDCTNKMIPELLEKPLDGTLMVLINTIYLNAKWMDPFAPNSINAKEFLTSKNTLCRPVYMYNDMMRANYFSSETAQGAILPYDDGNLAMMVLRPSDRTSAREFALKLNDGFLREFASSAREETLMFSMPKFTVEYSFDAKQPLSDMGMQLPFSDDADFSLIMDSANKDNPPGLKIDEVKQKVKLAVDEEGTQAAAATEVEFAPTSAPQPENLINFTLDSSFIYVVYDLRTNMILFLGIMDDPAIQQMIFK